MKNKILITTLPYNELSFKFISNHKIQKNEKRKL